MFLEDFARKRKLDPHDPSTWYSISWKNIAESQVLYFNITFEMYKYVYMNI